LDREFRQILVARVEERVRSLEGTPELDRLTAALTAGDLDPYEAADQLLGTIATLDDPEDGGRRFG
jgi:hypothetical protein